MTLPLRNQVDHGINLSIVSYNFKNITVFKMTFMQYTNIGMKTMFFGSCDMNFYKLGQSKHKC